MLQHPTIDRLRELGLDGLAKSLRDLTANPESKALDHMEWLGILLEHEMTLRQQKRFEARARTAKLAVASGRVWTALAPFDCVIRSHLRHAIVLKSSHGRERLGGGTAGSID